MSDRSTRCPICHEGTLADIGYDKGVDPEADLRQQTESRQLDVYTCGHQVPGAALAAADDQLDVERRTSDEATEPLPQRGR